MTGSGQIHFADLIEKIASQCAEEAGCILYDWALRGVGSGKTLCVFIDKPGSQIGVDDCAEVSRALTKSLDGVDGLSFSDSYQLEVSSPGIDRSLSRPWHYREVKEKQLKFKLRASLGDLLKSDKIKLGEGLVLAASWLTAKNFEAEAVDAVENGVWVKLKDKTSLFLPFSEIEKCKVVFVM